MSKELLVISCDMLGFEFKEIKDGNFFGIRIKKPNPNGWAYQDGKSNPSEQDKETMYKKAMEHFDKIGLIKKTFE